MCGIVGIIAHNARVAPELLEGATRCLAHRGPDDAGTIILGDFSTGSVEVGLGNRRLAILDLSPLAHQPMHDPDSGNWIVYNGEIYNFRELRAELECNGISFVSRSDTEVVLKAYAQWGESCLTKFRGMFAFAIWDASRQRLFLARDPMGIKPLYYSESGPYFVFASEVRTVLGTGLLSRTLDPAGLMNYLTFGSAYDPLTLVKGICALPAGHSLSWENGTIRKRLYWDLLSAPKSGTVINPRRLNGKSAGASDQAVSQLQPILEDAVRKQVVSDVPVGVFLSGGIDSSALVSILSRGGVTPSTFSVVFREAEFSEAEYSRAVAAKFRTDHHEIVVSQADCLAAIPDALRAMDLPTMDAVNTFFVSREARAAGVKVALSGLGGDELFAGYSTFRSVPQLEKVVGVLNHLPMRPRSWFASLLGNMTAASDQNCKLAALLGDDRRILHPYFLARMLFLPSQRDALFANADSATAEVAMASQSERLQEAALLDPINRVSYLELGCYMLNTLLRDADCMSMSQGLELRVPLIDHQLVQTAMAVPGPWKMDGKTPKKLLVEALAGTLPDQIVHRRKQGFTLPFELWLRGDLRADVEATLTKKFHEGPLSVFLDPTQVARVWSGFLKGVTSWSRPWSLYVLHRWCELNL